MSDNTPPGSTSKYNEDYEKLLLVNHILAGIGTIDACKRKVKEFVDGINFLIDLRGLADVKARLDGEFGPKIAELDGKDGVTIEEYHELLKELQVLLGEALYPSDAKVEPKVEDKE